MTPAGPPPAGTESDVRPTVGGAERRMPVWVFVAAALIGGAILFVALESRRHSLSAPAVKTAQIDLSAGVAPPALYIPPKYTPASPPVTLIRQPSVSAPPQPQLPARSTPPAQAPTNVPPPPFAPYMTPPPTQSVALSVRRDSSSVLVIDNGSAVGGGPGGATRVAPLPEAGGAATSGQAAQDTSRARAGAFANRDTTITQGTLIPAVLESALDSTRPGFARAVVSRDVRGFDGTRILIPRGSRLIGEYGAEAQPGQKRALVTWTRLIRPDGATIAIGSPVADTLGRTGVKARVNTHFFERFSGAILQSALNIGVNLASRKIGTPTVIALPGSLGGLTAQTIQPQQITPTLSVKRGTSISVFVARDLDFTGVEQAR